MNMQAEINFPEIAADVARALLGQPNRALSSATELRFGSRGSLSIDLTRAIWHDHQNGTGGGLLDLIARETGGTNGEAFDWLREKGFAPKRDSSTDVRRKIVATYSYRDEGGRVLFEVCRFHPKDFRQRAPDGHDGWSWSLKGVRRVLYRLPELAASPQEALVYLVEGEKDADRLAGLGFVATTCPGGAGKWRDDYAGALAGRRVVVLPDNDDAGRSHAAAVLKSLSSAGVHAAVLTLDGLARKGDVSDWLDAGGRPDDLVRLAEAALSRALVEAPGEAIEAGIVRDRKGRAVWCTETACAIMESNPVWKDVLAYDEFAGWTMLLRPIPGSKMPISRFRSRPLDENDITQAVRWFNRNSFPRATKNTTADALLLVAKQTVISPVYHYLEDLVWDGTERIDGWLSTYCGAADEALTRTVGRKWLISAVARALEPGCKADCALVLEGFQGAGKSSALRALASEEWFFDGLRDMHHKDASQALRGKWIIELPELSALRRSDVEAVKAFLSRTEERYRPPYGRTEVVEPRRCVFIGTTNRSDYLHDDTGGRRFWPVAVGNVDIAALARDQDQLWGEAVAAFRGGEKWWLDKADETNAAKVTALRSEDDPWAADVLSAAEGLVEVSTKEILQKLDIARERWTRAEAMRIAGILTREGWRRDGKFTGGPYRDTARYVAPQEFRP